MARRYDHRAGHESIPEIKHYPITPFEYNRRVTREVLNIGGAHHVPRVVADFSTKEKITAASFFALGYQYSVPLDKWNITDAACDFIFLGDRTIDFQIPGTLGLIFNHKTWVTQKHRDQILSLHFRLHNICKGQRVQHS